MTLAADPAVAPATPQREMDAAVSSLQERRRAWTAVSVAERIALLAELTRSFLAVAGRWAAACIAAEGLDAERGHAEESLVGPYFVLRNLRLLRLALADVGKHGQPRIPGSVRTRADGQVVARVFVRTASAAEPFVERIAAAYSYADAAPAPEPLVIDRLSL